MTEVDYVILVLIALSAIFGALRGFLREALGFATWIIALWMAWRHSDVVAPYLGGALSAEPFRLWAARGITLLIALTVGTLLAVLISQRVRVSLFSGLDRFLGFLFGVLRAGVVLGLAALLGHKLQLDREVWWDRSVLTPYAESAGRIVGGLVGERMSAVSADPVQQR